MIGKKVRVYCETINSEIKGTVESKGCFVNSYVVNFGNILIPIGGSGTKLYDNTLVFFEKQMTIID